MSISARISQILAHSASHRRNILSRKTNPFKTLLRTFAALMTLAMMAGVASVIAILAILQYYGRDLPDHAFLKSYQPPILTRIYADDGRMMATIAAEQRLFVPLSRMPKSLMAAFISAEDQRFLTHIGVDFVGIFRAMLGNIRQVASGRRPGGASTITQQVAKNMLLGNELSVARKAKEVLLALRLERSLDKQRILEIYLNEIFLGNRSWGVAAAALNYFNKSLNELSLSEIAYLAALPKAPNNYNPTTRREAAMQRRNWVLERMAEEGYITKADAEKAKSDPLITRERDETEVVNADYFVEDVRRELVGRFGDKTVLEGGLAVKTSLDPRLQAIAGKALQQGLIDFDRRQRGWRGAVARLPTLVKWNEQLKQVKHPAGGEEWPLAAVYEVKDSEALIATIDGRRGRIPLAELTWARREYPDGTFGAAIKKASDVLTAGDVIMVEEIPPSDKSADKAAAKSSKSTTAAAVPTFGLRQIPQVQGAFIALDPHTGRVFAMSGGFSSRISQFNRATQAYRQPGSAFKPFVYMTALENGFTPSSLVADSPAEFTQGPGMPLWRPENYSEDFLGPTPLLVGLEKSRNVMTVRLANALGMDKVVSVAKKYGVVDDMPALLSFSLGARETTLLRLAAAYGMFVNGGRKITPSLIDRVQDRDGRTIWRQDNISCPDCANNTASFTTPPELVDQRPAIEDPRFSFQIVSMLEGVVQRGTATRLKDTGITLAGKTGTTNDSKDAWFIGFTPDMVAGVYVGFDEPKQLGSKETGGSVAVPIFRAFITEAMKDKPSIPFRIADGVQMVRINHDNGDVASPADNKAILMPFLPDTEPQEGVPRPVLEGTTAGITGTTATQQDATAIDGGMGYETGIDAAGGGGTGDAGENGSAPDNITGGVTSPKPPLPPEVQGTGGLY